MYELGLKMFFRNFRKQKIVGILSIGSLAVAVAVVVLIGLWAINEFSFDKFQKDGDKMYRVCGSFMLNDGRAKIGATYKIVGSEVFQKFPQISEMCRVVPSDVEVKIDGVFHPKNEVFLTDTNFFSFFTFALKAGDPRTCLAIPDAAVIDEYTANRYFPGENPIGKSLNIGEKDFTVTALMENMPENSHIKAHIVTPFFGYWLENTGYGGTDAFITYFKIPDPADATVIGKRMTVLSREISPLFEQLQFVYELQPLYDIHFDNSFKFDWAVIHGNKSLVMTFLLTALMILLIACINFINLFVSTSFLRAKSIGVKKTHGADKKSLIKEFYIESFYYVLTAVVCGVMLAQLALPLFNCLADYHLVIDFTVPGLYLFLGVVFLFMMLMAGTFPALYMTKFNAVTTLKEQFKGKNISLLQKSLIIVQFTASIVILLAVFFIDKQVNYMVNKDLGFDKENVICVYDRGGFVKGFDAFRQEMKDHPGIVDVTLKDTDPTGWKRGDQIQVAGQDQKYLMEFCQIKPNYFDMMGMEMLAGVGFDETSGEVLHYCILNETAARTLGLAEPIGEKLYASGQELIICGIVKDAQTKSLRQHVDPQMYVRYMEQVGGKAAVMFKLQGNPQEAIQVIASEWNALNSGMPFEYHFLDDTYARLYKAETNAGQILTAAMGITMIISVAGLFAMAYYTTQRRLREVGIRKVNGASLSELLLILNRGFFGWVGISFILACPIAYFFISHWQEDFTDRTSLSWDVFALVGSVTFIVVLLTVSYQTWKAANVKPVEVLKSE